MTQTLCRSKAPWALCLLPPFPAIAQRVLAIVGNEDLAIAQLGDLVKMDPSFSAELLRVANSALFGARHEVKSISHAIFILGLDRVKTMATLVALNRMVRSALRLEALRKVWLHSLVTAVIAEEAAKVAGLSAETAYTAGLLHNLGTLGLMAAYPEEYNRMIEVTQDLGFDLLQTERDLFDIDHCRAGCHLAQDWDFPDELSSAIAVHHEDPVPGEPSLDNLVKISWRLADVLGFAAFPQERPWSYEDLIACLPNGKSFAAGQSLQDFKASLNCRLSAAPV